MAIRKLFDKIAKAIKWEHIDDSAVRENNIQDSAVTEAKHATGGVSTRALANTSVTEPKYATGSVSTRALANAAVTVDKLDPSARTKASVGLGNVDNTSDADKPVSSATQALLDNKEPKVPSGSANQYWRGDKMWATLTPASVLANTPSISGTLTETTPGFYSYSAATGKPPNATAGGSLLVYSTGPTTRAQILVDTNGFAWSRAYSGSVWSSWVSMTPGGNPKFYGKRDSQTHAADVDERIDYTTIKSKYITNNAGQLVITTPGDYHIIATSTGPWKDNVNGTGRWLRIQKNGIIVDNTSADVPVVWSGVGAFSLTAQAVVTCAANDTIECRFLNGTHNSSITAHHKIAITFTE